jgi:hypothetical protein
VLEELLPVDFCCHRWLLRKRVGYPKKLAVIRKGVKQKHEQKRTIAPGIGADALEILVRDQTTKAPAHVEELLLDVDAPDERSPGKSAIRRAR